MNKFIISGSIMIYFILLIILILNMEDKSKIIKYSFLTFMIVLLIVFFLSNELVMDYLISIIIRFLYFPSFSTIIAIVLLSIILYTYNIFNDNIPDKNRIINYIFASLIFVGYIVFMLLNVNINSYNSLYEGDSLICIRYITRTFTFWMISVILIKYFNYLKERS